MADATLSGSGQASSGQGSSGSLPSGGIISVSEIAQGARAALDEVKDAGVELMNNARDGANSMFEEQRNRAADEIASLGEVLRSSAKSLDEGTGTSVARYADQAAGTISDFADTLRQRSVGQMADDVESFARQWPMAFIASAVGIGFVASRFLMSTGSRPAQPTASNNNSARISADEPSGGARHDHGAVTGPLTGNAKSGDGTSSGEHR